MWFYMKKIQNIVLLLAVLANISACGNTTSDRALSGAGIGAGVGAVGGALAGANPVAGAAVGAAVGGTVGAVVKKESVNLGKTIWK